MKLKFTLSNGQTLEITNKQILSSSFVDYTSNADEIRIGTASSCELDVTIKNFNKELTGYEFANAQIDAYWDDDTKLGHFYVSNVEKTRSTWKIESEDILNKTDVTWVGYTFPCNIYEILTSVCNQVGISLYNEKEDFENFDIVVNTYEDLEGSTCREIIKYVAEVLGKYAVINSNGLLEFKWYDLTNTKTTITYSNSTSFKINEKDTKRDGILVLNGNSTIQVGDSSCSFIIDNNPLLASSSDNDLYTITNRIWESIKNTEFAAGEFKLRTISGIRAGDCIKVEEEDGTTRKAIVTQLTIDSDVCATIDSFGDNDNVSDSTSTSTNGQDTTETYSTEVYFGRAKNNQRIHCRKGTYLVCEKVVNNVTKFTQVNMEVSILFEYTPNKFCYFSLYANDILLRKEIPVLVHEGLNYFTLAEVADTTGMEATNYTLKVRVDDDCEIDIQPFDAILSLKVKSGKINDVQATDQYFSNRTGVFKTGSLTWKKLGSKTISAVLNAKDDVDVNIEELTPSEYGPWDISKNRDNSVIATLYTNGLLYIVGQNDDIESNVMIDSADFYGWANGSNGKVASNTIKKINFKNVYNIGSNFLTHGIDYYSNLEEVKLSSNFQEIGGSLFKSYLNESTILSIYFEGDASGGISHAKKIVSGAFKNCTNFKQHNLYFDYAERSINPVTGGKYISGGVDFGSGGEVFYGCTNLTGQIIFRATDFGSIGGTSMFAGSGVSSIVIEEVIYTVNDEGEYTINPIHFSSNFAYGCTNLGCVMCCGAETAYPYEEEITDFTFPQDIEYMFIGDKAFYNTAINVVYMPGITEITGSTFVNVRLNYCSGVTAKVFTKDAGNDCKLILKDTIIHNEDGVKSAFVDFGISDVTGYILEE